MIYDEQLPLFFRFGHKKNFKQLLTITREQFRLDGVHFH
jgi:hypothetical protein